MVKVKQEEEVIFFIYIFNLFWLLHKTNMELIGQVQLVKFNYSIAISI